MPFIQEQNEIREDYKGGKSRTSTTLTILGSRTTKGLLIVLFFAVVVPFLIYYLLIDGETIVDDKGRTCLVSKIYRVRCGKDENVTLDYCDRISCCFDNSTKLCFHYLPSKYYYFSEEINATAHKPSLPKTPFGKSLSEQVALTLGEVDENTLRIILHETGVPVDDNKTEIKNYRYNVSHEPLYVDVYRNGTEDLLLTTSKGPTIISERYWEWSFQLTEQYLFGLGQVLIDLDENSTLTKVIYANSEDHNTLPIFMAYNNGKYHGLIVRHSGPLEVTVLPSKLVILKSLAGSDLILELSVGPTPQDVMRQQRRGQQSNLVDLWSLGVHICREGSPVTLDEILNRYDSDNFDFSYESHCLHQNLLMALRTEENFGSDKLIDAVTKLKSQSKRFVLALSPQIPVNTSIHNKTKDLSVFYEDEEGHYQGQYLRTAVIYPYFGHNSISDLTTILIDELLTYFTEQHLPTDLVLTNNWPSDDAFKMDNSDDDFQYLSEDLMEAMSSTLPWNVSSANQSHIIHHNDYGALQVKTIAEALQLSTSENISVMTASHNFDTFNPIIVQNYDTSWSNFKLAIAKTLYSSIFGDYLLSVPVCGSTANYETTTHESLCIRWYLMASTAPIFRISSEDPPRDPNSLNSGTAREAAKSAIRLRYNLQFYFYTVLNNFEPLMRPMFYDFHQDTETFALTEQYMVGKSLMVAHPTLPDKTQLSIYLPPSVGTWYDFFSGTAYTQNFTENGWISPSIVETDWIGFIPDGSVLPIKEVDKDGMEVLKLLVALRCVESNGACVANGSLLLESGDLFAFNADAADLTVERKTSYLDQTGHLKIDQIVVYRHGEDAKFIKDVNEDIFDVTNISIQVAY